MIARASIVHELSNLHKSKECFDRVYVRWQCDTFKIDNVLVYHILSKNFIGINTYVYLNQRNYIQDGCAVYYNIHKQFLGPDHNDRQTAKQKLSYKPHTMIVRRKDEIGKSMLYSTRI